MKDCGQNLDKTVPTKFRNCKFATLYLEVHIDLEKFNHQAHPIQLWWATLSQVIIHLECPHKYTNKYRNFSRGDPSLSSSDFINQVKYNNLAYVAKRCYTLGCGRVLSITTNHEELVKEGTTLGRAKFFLNNFKEEYFDVTDFILAREGVLGLTEPFNPSPASGLKKSDYTELSDDNNGELIATNAIISSVTWLLEPERGNVQFRKYSGTLEHPRYTDKQGATVNAFQHFTYINSNKSLVIADIQSTVIASENHDPSNKASVLFDLMSHTLIGHSDSGAGDHGEKGIQTFVDQHKCGQRCALMEMEALKDIEEEE
ncbi:kinase-like domain-containing protein [Mycena leptocephala]|nr:kinase-like domain-containing protein [Mycena leptocephala]